MTGLRSWRNGQGGKLVNQTASPAGTPARKPASALSGAGRSHRGVTGLGEEVGAPPAAGLER